MLFDVLDALLLFVGELNLGVCFVVVDHHLKVLFNELIEVGGFGGVIYQEDVGIDVFDLLVGTVNQGIEVLLEVFKGL